MSLILSPEESRILERLRNDLPYFAAKCLKITRKDGSEAPFVFNSAQHHLHREIESQKAQSGKVRAVILKGRQQGCSTYIAARYFHQALFNRNRSIYILAHQAESTKWLYSIVRRYYEGLPPFFQFPLVKDTERAMEIDNGSVYSVGTAGSAQIGRGFTIQNLHASEVAFYENTDELSTGLMQAVADVPGTEVIIESTANGPGNFFHSRCMGALTDATDYRLIFIPWYWQTEYTAPALLETALSPKEEKIYEAHKDKGLTLAHLAWRRKKIAEEDGKEWKVDQEYPNTIQEAFVRADSRFFDIPKLYAARAREAKVDEWAPLIIGVDPGRTGDDTAICRRRGRTLLPLEMIPADDGYQREMRLAGRLAKIIESEKPDQMFIDMGGGAGTLDRLHELGYKKIVRGVNFGEGALDEQFLNKRCEMGHLAKDWFDDEGVSIPDDEEFISDLAALPEARETSSGRKVLEPKDKIREDLKRSPNKGDAFFLTFAYPVKKARTTNDPRPTSPKSTKPNAYRPTLNVLKGVKHGVQS